MSSRSGAVVRRAAVVVSAVLVAAVALAGCAGQSLTGQKWLLAATTASTPAFQGVVPAEWMTKYTIEFAEDGTWTGLADCNTISGTYETGDDDAITITLGPSTLVACPEGSLADLYVAGLAAARTYKIGAEQLILGLEGDDTFTFASQPEG